MHMRKNVVLATAFTSAAVALFLFAHSIRGANSADIALNGQVSSIEEGPMEGVLVSAKRAGSTVTTTVVSDGQGHYTFPAKKLEPGQYAISIRAAGYEVDGPTAATIRSEKTTAVDLKLRKTQDLLNDRNTRLDPKSGQFTEYLLPKSTNVRRVFVDNSTTPVTFWVGSNHGASIIKLEPLE